LGEAAADGKVLKGGEKSFLELRKKKEGGSVTGTLPGL